MTNWKALLFIFVSASLSHAQDFINGQAARAVIGQYAFTYADNIPGQQVVGAVGGLAWANGTLYVADSSPLGTFPPAPDATSNGPITVNNRLLFFNTTQIPGADANLATLTPFDNFNCNVCGYPASNVLGEPDYLTTVPDYPLPNVNATYGTPTQSNLRAASGVASDGRVLIVADTGNNRVLIWSSIPTSINAPANIVLGQPNFTTSNVSTAPTSSSLRAPQGVWIQNGKLYVADTQDNRVLVWNSIPTSNNQPADMVLGQVNFTTNTYPPPQNTNPNTTANLLLDPTGVSSDGVHLFVADRGYNRVLIWNSIPTSNDQPADVVIGQPVMTTAVPDWVTTFCASNGTYSTGQPSYPQVCAGTLDLPSFVLPDNNGRLFVADQGNDRVLIYNTIPARNGASADIVLGQPNMTSQVISSQAISIASTAIDNTAGVDLMPSPTSLAWDGANLYVSDPYNLRVLIFTPGNVPLADNSVVNWASEIIRQEGAVTLTGTIASGDVETVTIGTANYTYTVKSSDTLDTVAQGLVTAINAGAGDPNVTAIFAGTGTATVFLSSKGINLAYDSIALSFTPDSVDDIIGATSGAYLSAGTAATGAPGMLVEIDGSNLTDYSEPVVASLSGGLAPTTLGGVQVFMDGLAAPIFRASNIQIITQVPFAFSERNSTSIYVRTTRSDGSITVTNATPMYIAPANPGLFATPVTPGQSPVLRPAEAAYHQSGNPEDVIDFEGTITAGNTATITVNSRAYTYTVLSSDTLTSITQALASLINASDPQVTASIGAAFNRVVLIAKQPGAAGNGIPITTASSTSATVTLTAYNGTTCCDVTPGTAITASNPAAPGEVINVSAAGVGAIGDITNTSQLYAIAGFPYNGPEPNSADNFVTATMGGSTAEVVSAGFASGAYGVYEIQMMVPTSLTANNSTQLYVAQNAYVSNIVTIPVGTARQVAGGTSSNGNSVFSTGIVFTASPNPVPPGSNGLGTTTLTWANAPGDVAIYEGNPSAGGGQIALGTSRGQTTAKNVADGTVFYLQDFTNPNPKSLNATLASVTVHILSGIAIGIDSPNSTTAYSGTALFGGWALDPLSAVSTVTVKIDGASVGTAIYGGDRADACAAHSGAPGCPNVGWSFSYNTAPLANGTHTFEVTAKTASGSSLSQAASFTVRNPISTNGTIALIDTPNSQLGPVQGIITASGWAVNPNAVVGSIAILIDGTPYGNATPTSRPDVCSAYPSSQGCPNVGWSILIDTNSLANGTHTLEAVATANNGQISAAGSSFTVANWTSSNPMIISVGTPNAQGGPYTGIVGFGGWAADMDARIASIGVMIDNVFYGNAGYGGNRADACASITYPGCPNVGWAASIDTTQLPDGTHFLGLIGTTTNGESSTKSVAFKVVNITPTNPLHLHIDTPSPNTTLSGTAQFVGWAVADNGSIASVQILIDNIARGTAQYGVSRSDVCSAFPGRAGCPNVGWTFSFDTTTLTYGSHTLAVKALSSTGKYATIGETFSVSNSYAGSPITIAIEQPASHTNPYEGLAQFSGWAVDKNVPVSSVAMSIDGVPYGDATYGISRTDVCAGLPGVPGCPNIGWSFTLDTTKVPDGIHYLGVDVTGSNGDHSIVSWVFTVGNWSTANTFRIGIDSPNAKGSPYFGTVNFGGWALNPNLAITSVQVAVDGVSLGSATYGGVRADACAANGNAPGCPNVGWNLTVDTTQFPNGTHTVDVTAIAADGQTSTSTNTFTTSN